MALLALSLLAGCNSYELFRITGFEQASFSNDADILFVIDNSDSMQEEATSLATNFDVFINKLTNAQTGSNVATETLADAVGNYLRETSGDTLFIDYQLAVTTSSVFYTNGKTENVDDGEAGTLAGSGVVGRGVDASLGFRTNLFCNATCWSETTMPSDPGYTCGDPLEGDVSEEYLDCLCGVGEWQDNCGSGTEQPLEAAYMSLCRAVENPPEDCYLFPDNAAIAFQSGEEQSNAGLLREGANTLVVMVTDEGDTSYRHDDHERGEDGYPAAAAGTVEEVVDEYLDLFEAMPNVVRFAVIGPAWDGSNGDCLDSAQTWGVERYQMLVEETNGLYIPLTDIENGCAATDFATNLEQLGDLLSNLMTYFPLQSVPDVSSIEVYIDGELKPSAAERNECLPADAETDTDGNIAYVCGWAYDASENAVRFFGPDVPDYNQDVRIYYRPLGGTPRELPF